MTANNKYQAVIGLEVHAQLLTNSKLFCGDSTHFGEAPNSQVSPISLAHPGTLPKMNKAVIELAVKLGLAMNCNISTDTYFARKNYFYPDLPKGYQVSQDTDPICKAGYLTIKTANGEKNVQLNRIHMEEDAGKSLHDQDEHFTSIDLNRAGMPLLEIVTEPDMHSAEEAYAYLTELRKLLRWTGVCDGNMEEGSMRCDANVSVRLNGVTTLGTRVEVKNLNSIRNVKKAIEIEIERLIDLTEKGETIRQETRSFNADNNTTFALRSKEEADDYRYFPEPDLPPFRISAEFLEKVKNSMPGLPAQLEKKYQQELGLSAYDTSVICSDKADADFFETLIHHTKYYKAAANWMLGPLKSYCNENNISLADFPLKASTVAVLVDMAAGNEVNFNNASGKLLNEMIAHPSSDARALAASLNILQEKDDDSTAKWVDEVINAMPEKVKEYRSGKKGLAGMFAGEVKKLSKGKADMQLVNKLLSERLNNG